MTAGPAVIIGTFVTGACLLFLPGALALRLVRLRGLSLWALAPAVSMAAYGIAAIGAPVLGVRWGLGPALAGAGAAVAFAVGMRALEALLPLTPRSGGPVGLLAAGIGLGSLLAAGDIWIGAGGLEAILQRWDALFHLSALELVSESGSASSFTLGGLSYGDGHAAIYPAAWHAFTAVLPAPAPVALNISSTLFSALAWVIGMAALARELLPGHRLAPAATAVLAGIITPTPTSLWVGWGHIPNAAALAMVPGAAAFVLRVLIRQRPTTARPRAGTIVVLCAVSAGLGLTHPNAFLALGLLALPAAAWVIADFSRRWWRAAHRIRAVVVPGVGVALVLGVAVAFLASPLSSAVTGYTGSIVNPPGVALLEVVTGWYDLWATPASALVLVLAPWGAWRCAHGGRGWVAALMGLVWLTYFDAAIGGPLGLSGLWYSSSARLSVMVAMVSLPLALAGWIDLWRRLPSRVRERRAAAAGVMVIVAVLAVSTSVYSAHRSARVFDATREDQPRFAGAAELQMIRTVDLGHGSVLGSPFTGAPLLYSLRGQPVVFPVAGQVWSEQQHRLMAHLDQLGTPAGCAVRAPLDVTYLYQDSDPYERSRKYAAINRLTIPGAEVVAEAGTARILRLPSC